MIIIMLIFFIYTKYIENKYKDENKNISEEDLKVITEVVSLAKEKIKLEYVWGGKGEVITEERLNELISEYGIDYYPLNKERYIGKQGFDCSGLTYWTYKKATGINIGYSTIQQKDILKSYKVSKFEIQPGDLIYTPGHVVMYIGKGQVIQSSNNMVYPIGGVKQSPFFMYSNGDIYRPIDYINNIKEIQ
ncbi:Probable endopeptidase Spr precursor [uncultured Clostridium sp.]|nr:Probable endopeptidase Spr precursor [uncultured Clostridium sp.]